MCVGVLLAKLRLVVLGPLGLWIGALLLEPLPLVLLLVKLRLVVLGPLGLWLGALLLACILLFDERLREASMWLLSCLYESFFECLYESLWLCLS